MRLLCFEYKVVTLDYFLDRMTDNEIPLCMENIPYCDVNMWESTRLKMYTSVQMMSKNKIGVKDIMKFSWDDEDEDNTAEHNTTITQEEIDRLKRLSKILK